MARAIPFDIIDCHFHPAVDKATDTNWFHSSGSVEAQIETLKRAGITQACGAPVKRESINSFDDIQWLNDQALALRDRFSEFYLPAIHVHPHYPQESCKEIERCCGGEGVRWIGELVGYMMGYAEEYATKNALTIMKTAQKHDAVVNFHCSDLETVEQLCRACPDLKLVLAHPGAGRDIIQPRLAMVARFANLHLDISGSGIDRFGILRHAIDVSGKEKLVFGTDYPINNPGVYTHGAMLEELSDEELRAIFRGNFLRLVSDIAVEATT